MRQQPPIRREIRDLSPDTLNAFRSAMMDLQMQPARGLSEFQKTAGIHRHNYNQHSLERLLGWHRAYLLDLERKLKSRDPTIAIPYWDWTRPGTSDPTGGVPVAFHEKQWTQPDGSRVPNPLAGSMMDQGSQSRPTVRAQKPDPRKLWGLDAHAKRALSRPDFLEFALFIRDPHDLIHTWVGMDMKEVANTAYDPLFWAHHSMVDRLWAAWQKQWTDATTPASVRAMKLVPFNVTVEEVLDIRNLGYEYDSLPEFPPKLVGRQIRKGLFQFDGATPKAPEPRLHILGLPQFASSYQLDFYLHDAGRSASDRTLIGTAGVFGIGSHHHSGSHGSEHHNHDASRTVFVRPDALTAMKTGGFGVEILATTGEEGEPVELSTILLPSVSLTLSV